jgi:glycosyltransferase involved in cell wall biosynthesis
MSKKPLISILIPVFNRAQLIGRAIESALNQTYSNIEVIVVDNASTDDTYNVAKRYAQQDRRVRVYQNIENIGPVRNWRRCAELAKGEFAGLLFSDDWYEPTFVEKALEYLEDPEIGFVFSKVKLVDVREPGQEVKKLVYDIPYEGKLPSRVFLEDHLYLALRPPEAAMPVSPGCSLCRLFDLRTGLGINIPDPYDIGYMDHGAGPDLLVNLFNAVWYPYFAYIPEPLVNFYLHDANLNLHPKATLAYILAKSFFVEKYGLSCVNYRKFCTALFWMLWRVGRLDLYPFLTKNKVPWHQIDWIWLSFYAAMRIIGRLKSATIRSRRTQIMEG